MNITPGHIELYDRYLARTLSKSWCIAFEKKLSDDLDFKNGFEQHKLITQSLKKEGRKMLKESFVGVTTLSIKVKKYRTRRQRIVRKIIFGGVLFAVMAAVAIQLSNKEKPTPKIEKTIPAIEEPVIELKEESVIELKEEPVIEQRVQRQVIHDTINVYEYDTIQMTQEEATLFFDNGGELIDTIALIKKTEYRDTVVVKSVDE